MSTTINAHVSQMLRLDPEGMFLENGDGLRIDCKFSRSGTLVFATKATQTDWISVEDGTFDERTVPLGEAVAELAQNVPGNMDNVDGKFSVLVTATNEMHVLVWRDPDTGNGCCLDVIK